MKRKFAVWAGAMVLAGVGGYAVSQDGVDFDTDRFGGDYREVNLRPGETYEVCAKACIDDQRCLAWTWVPQGTQREEGPNCWLKDSTPEKGRVAGLVSGLRGYGVTPAPTPASTGSVVIQRNSGSDKAVGNVYDTDFNDLTVTRWDRDGFEAAYEHARGRMTGQANGSTTSGYWYQDSSPVECSRAREGSKFYGRFSFRFSADRNSFTGRWSYCDEAPNRDWNGTYLRVAGSQPATTGTSTAPAQVGKLILFEGNDFGGRSISLDRDTASLHTEALEFGDSTWSLAAEGRWSVCEDVEYGGQCQVFEGDHAQLYDWGGTISSVRYLGPGASSAVVAGGAGNGARNGNGSGNAQGPSAVETAAERAARVAAEEAERRVHDRIREGIGRIF